MAGSNVGIHMADAPLSLFHHIYHSWGHATRLNFNALLYVHIVLLSTWKAVSRVLDVRDGRHKVWYTLLKMRIVDLIQMLSHILV